jgi:hypothetical protein
MIFFIAQRNYLILVQADRHFLAHKILQNRRRRADETAAADGGRHLGQKGGQAAVAVLAQTKAEDVQQFAAK